MPLGKTAMRKETMIPRERWLAVLNRQKPDRVPMDYWATPEATEKTMAHLNCHSKREMLEKLHVDFAVEVKPAYVGPSVPAQHDEFGCTYQNVPYGTGEYEECVFHPLARFESVEEIKRSYTWPDPDWWDYSGIKKQLQGNERYPILGGNYEPFLIYKKLRGEEQAYMDMALNPEIVHFCLESVRECVEYFRSPGEEVYPGRNGRFPGSISYPCTPVPLPAVSCKSEKVHSFRPVWDIFRFP